MQLRNGMGLQIWIHEGDYSPSKIGRYIRTIIYISSNTRDSREKRAYMSLCIMSICSGRNSGLGLFLPFFFTWHTKQGIREERKEGTMMRRKKKPNIRGGGWETRGNILIDMSAFLFIWGLSSCWGPSFLSLTAVRPLYITHSSGQRPANNSRIV